MKIGVFDSGVGGLGVAYLIQRKFPEHEIVLRQDTQHVPYGKRKPEEILKYVLPIFENLSVQGCSVVVIACNTVSTTLFGELRDQFPQLLLMPVEPMIQQAAELTRSGIITVCATPATLQSPRYTFLKQQYAAGIQVLEPDCSDWAFMIEHKAVEERKIEKRLIKTLDQGADVIVLGCTHYHWIESEIAALAAGRAKVIQPEPALIAKLRQILAARQV